MKKIKSKKNKLSKIDYVEIAVETNENNEWIGLCYPKTIKDARKEIERQVKYVRREKKNLRIIKRIHLIIEEKIK